MKFENIRGGLLLLTHQSSRLDSVVLRKKIDSVLITTTIIDSDGGAQDLLVWLEYIDDNDW